MRGNLEFLLVGNLFVLLLVFCKRGHFGLVFFLDQGDEFEISVSRFAGSPSLRFDLHRLQTSSLSTFDLSSEFSGLKLNDHIRQKIKK